MRFVKMAVLKNIGSLTRKLLSKNGPIICLNRGYASEYDLFLQEMKPLEIRKMMPGPYPTTEEERRAAAEKYGMHPDEYKPLPHDETGAGDYPDLPWISVEARDPYYPWDMPAIRRNYGEPIHYQFDMMGEDRYDYGVRQFLNGYKCAAIFVIFFVGSYFFLTSFKHTVILKTEKQWPGKGVHYTFEPAH
ncbi:NADH:ubiquinone oxidoreductase subunit ASHI [Calliopsis andreniformis]|uniref:NADH:ubiquinone oxidoreductase subunit ASHI n=1 Tax=Calliopsis andreniformis TaxID=337506 RepID=UPI003FCDEEB6